MENISKNKHNEECTKGHGTPCSVVHTNPATDVSWEKEFDEIFGTFPEMAPKSGVKVFIRKQIDLAYDAGGKTVGGTGRVMYEKGYDEGYAFRGGIESEQKQRMFEAGKGIGRKETLEAVKEMLIKRYSFDGGSALVEINDTTQQPALPVIFLILDALSNK